MFSAFFLFFFTIAFLRHIFFNLISFLLTLRPQIFFYMELQGTIKKISDLQTFASGFQKREMVLLTEEQYPQPINIEFLTDKADLLNQYKEGEKVKVGINIRGREWTSPQGEVKYFNSITGWRVEKVDAGSNFNEPVSAQGAPAASANSNTNVFTEDEDDDLPF